MKRKCHIFRGSLLVFVFILLFGFASCAPVQNEHASAPEASAPAPSYAPEEVPDAASESTAQEPSSQAGGLGDLTHIAPPDTNHKLIYRATLVVQTENFEQDYALFQTAAQTANGYIEHENTYGSQPIAYGDEGRYSEIVFRIPVASYDAFMKTASGIGTLKEKQLNTEDISQNYFDTTSRIEMLETRYNRLEEHLQQATKMDDIIALEEELSEILYQLDELKGAKRGMDNLVEYTTVTLTLEEVVLPKEVAPSTKDVGERAADSFSASMLGVGKFFEDLAVLLAAAAPVLFVLLGIGAIVVLILVGIHLFRKKKSRKSVPPTTPKP